MISLEKFFLSPRAKILLFMALSISVMITFVPFLPDFPQPELDHSWTFAINEAVARGFVFGKDILFTFGPYAAVYTRQYHPATDSLMMLGALLIAMGYVCGLFLFWKKATPYKLALGIILLPALTLKDPLFLCLPLLLFFVAQRIALPQEAEERIELTPPVFISFNIITMAVGLLPLIKGSFLPFSFLTMGFTFLICWASQKRILACVSLFVFILTIPIAWIGAGQPISALPKFFSSMFPITQGYNQTMVYGQDLFPVILFILCASYLLHQLNKNLRDAAHPFHKAILLMIAVALFLAFKTGFVRNDGHRSIATGALLLITWLSMNFLSARKANICFVFSLLCWLLVGLTYRGFHLNFLYGVPQTLADAYHGVPIRLFHPEQLQERFTQSLADIRLKNPLPTVVGTTDIYSVQQSRLLASANAKFWSPRPTIQSYGASTPELVSLNAQHLMGKEAVQNIFFRPEAIDGRLPSIEDGPGWLLILKNYTFISVTHDLALFKKKETQNFSFPLAQGWTVTTGTVGNEIELPTTGKMTFSRIELHPTLYGRLISFLYKPVTLSIYLTLEDGTQKRYRYLPTLGQVGFLLSPLVQNTQDFVDLASHRLNKKVKSFYILPNAKYMPWLQWQWSREFTVHLKQFD